MFFQKLESHTFFCFKKAWSFFNRSFSISNSLTRFCSFFTSYVELKSAFPCPGNALSPYSSYSLIQRRRLQPLIPNSVAVCVTDLSDSCASFTAAILNCLSYTARFIIWTAFLLLFSFCPVYYTPYKPDISTLSNRINRQNTHKHVDKIKICVILDTE